jgi:hypothetical protein
MEHLEISRWLETGMGSSHNISLRRATGVLSW